LLRSQPERPDDALPERVKVLLTALAVRLAADAVAVDHGAPNPSRSDGEARAKDSEGERESAHVAPPRTELQETEDARVALGDAPPALMLQVLTSVCTPAQLRAGPHAEALASLAHGAAARNSDATTTLGGASQASPSSSSSEPPADVGGTPQRGAAAAAAARAARAEQATAASPRSVALVTWVRGATHSDDNDAAAVESLLCTALQLDLPAADQSAADQSAENAAAAAVVQPFPSGGGGGESGSIAAAAAAAACVRPWVTSRVEAGRGVSTAVRDALVARCLRTVSRLGPVACGGGGGGSGGGGGGAGGGGAAAGVGGGVGVEVQTEAPVPSAPLSTSAGVSSAWVAAERCAAAAAVLEAVRTLTVLCAADATLPPRCLASLARLQVRPSVLSGPSVPSPTRTVAPFTCTVGPDGRWWPRHARTVGCAVATALKRTTAQASPPALLAALPIGDTYARGMCGWVLLPAD
jgi:hypothetical protein